MANKKIELRILRRNGPQEKPYWDEFQVDYVAGMNIISCLMAIQREPVNKKGEAVRPVVWECNCLEEVCGACTMNINGGPRQACTALVDKLRQPIELRPMNKFPVLRDLMVDRKRLFDGFKRVKAWVPIDGTFSEGPGPKVSPELQERRYALSRCMACGCCMEACPQFNDHSDFIGPAPLVQADLFALDSTAKLTKEERLREVMKPGGHQGCSNAQNCVKVCPKEIPITSAIADLGRETTKLLLKDLLG